MLNELKILFDFISNALSSGVLKNIWYIFLCLTPVFILLSIYRPKNLRIYLRDFAHSRFQRKYLYSSFWSPYTCPPMLLFHSEQNIRINLKVFDSRNLYWHGYKQKVHANVKIIPQQKIPEEVMLEVYNSKADYIVYDLITKYRYTLELEDPEMQKAFVVKSNRQKPFLLEDVNLRDFFKHLSKCDYFEYFNVKLRPNSIKIFFSVYVNEEIPVGAYDQTLLRLVGFIEDLTSRYKANGSVAAIRQQSIVSDIRESRAS